VRWEDLVGVDDRSTRVLADLLAARRRPRRAYHTLAHLEKGPDWYGISADTLARGVDRLGERGLLTTDKTYKKAPLSPVGYTAEHRYTLAAPFGPIGKQSSSSRLAARTRVR
jgi:hypothetical protein